MKAKYKNTGTKEFPFYTITVDGEYYCATDDVLKAKNLVRILTIPIVSKSLRDKEQFIELAKMIEIHIQKSVDYKASIGTGYFTERFNEVYKKYLESNVC